MGFTRTTAGPGRIEVRCRSGYYRYGGRLGDAWTNLIQPFWALPLLGVLGLKIKDIMGYCFILCIWVGIVTSLLMLFVY